MADREMNHVKSYDVASIAGYLEDMSDGSLPAPAKVRSAAVVLRAWFLGDDDFTEPATPQTSETEGEKR